ncbi:hypothetical protein ONS95_008006 [Cadophora gregata]|uniref:uncharacterized protein n=1 Tax=Cadophora gregata TaxID=51156 RepID=UPI0026DB5525|nr:uncharacterized protein ONS95_008006 [Cadophora gregata]KAK0119146.1 hypothetical protein ONS96_012212 [Cadophora gregata f. sp. sojae]KAK0126403.1 hypothetical protein ONS95_008006 [Cadophora gregata]
MWRRARSNVIAPQRAEADAVQAMRELYAWSVAVTQCRERDGITLGEGNTRDFITGINVADAAVSLCQWLGDEWACHRCDDILHDLMGLTETEAAGGRWQN